MGLFRILFLFFVVLYHQGYSILDLEEKAQDFVLEIRQIQLPEHPHAFNPSIIRWKERLLLTFRILPDLKDTFTSRIGAVWLDEEFNPIGKPQLLNILPKDALPHIPSRAEDARLINIGEHLYIVYSDNRDAVISKGGFRVYVAELEIHGDQFKVKNINRLASYPGESSSIREKNWVPFVKEEKLLLAYSLQPHRIFNLSGMGSCEIHSESETEFEWKWGIMRGGTPALKIDDHFYLAFFHSSTKMVTIHSQEKEILHYFMGAYVFSQDPPYAIKGMSPEPIVARGFYSGEIYKPYWHPVRAIFPGGFIFDQQYVWVVYGRQDHEMWVAKLDKKGLLNTLIPPSQ